MERDVQEEVSARSARERQRAETRERLFQAALDEIRQEGVGGAQVDRIVASVGVARGTFYFHFPTKEDVLIEYDRRRELEIVEVLQAVLQHGVPLRLALTGQPHGPEMPKLFALLSEAKVRARLEGERQ